MDGAALQKVVLRNLDPNFNNIFIIAVIIAKQHVRKFSDFDKTKPERAVWNFTVRDSVKDYINVSYWGTSAQIESLSQKFQIGDIVDIINPKINVREINDKSERFRPLVTSPFSLTLTERSNITHHPGETNLSYLLFYPTKPVAGFVPLRDIQQNGNNMDGVSVDVLAAVRKIEPPRSITTKNGKNLQVRGVQVCDHTSTNLKINLWDLDLISLANSWITNETIIFITDLTIKWSGYERCFIATTTSRTVVTVNPRTSEANALKKYINTFPIESQQTVNPASIKEIMNIRQIHERINSILECNEHQINNQFSVILYAMVSKFDLDGYNSVVTTKCNRCKTILKMNANCELMDCAALNSAKETILDIPINLSDHTATLLNCRLSGTSAENVLGCSPTEFQQKSEMDKHFLKWRFLLERCAVRLTVVVSNNRPKITILTMELANTSEMAQKLAVY